MALKLEAGLGGFAPEAGGNHVSCCSKLPAGKGMAFAIISAI